MKKCLFNNLAFIDENIESVLLVEPVYMVDYSETERYEFEIDMYISLSL